MILFYSIIVNCIESIKLINYIRLSAFCYLSNITTSSELSAAAPQVLTLIIILKNIDFKTFDLSEVSKLKGSSSGFHKGRFTQGISVCSSQEDYFSPSFTHPER